MLYEIVHLIVDVVGGLVVGACLLRAWMQWLRIGNPNPLSNFVLGLSDWIVRPLRRVVPGYAGVDWSSLIAALLITLAAVRIDLVLRIRGVPPIEYVLGLTAVWLVKWTLWIAMIVILIEFVLILVNPLSPFMRVFDAMTSPLLNWLRRLLPRAGRIDWAPLVALLVIQIALIVVNRISYQTLGTA